MASPSSICASCLRAMQQSAFRAKSTPPSLFRNTTRAYRSAAATSHQSMYLDFLAPSYLHTPRKHLSVTGATPSSVSISHSSRRTATTAAATVSNPAHASPPPPSTPQNQQARAILNSKNDEDGQPMLISLSPRAAHRLSSISAADNNPNSALRITVESGGCHGFQYLMNLVDLGKEPPAEDDCVFEGQKGAKVVIDESSLELLKGSTLDYTMELIGSQFKVTGIPGATSSCGCGTSFDIKL